MKDGYHLSSLTAADKPALIKYLNEREIFLRTLNIPFPYTQADADFWIDHVAGKPGVFALRSPEEEMIGSVGLDGLVVGKMHRAEIGYWLAKPYWGKGLVTQAVADVLVMAFGEFGLQKVTASIFAFNTGSQRVLEKNGFVQEGELKRHYKKDGQLLDARVFAKFI